MLLLSRNKVGLVNSAWKWSQVISRLKLVVCHQYRSICAVLIDPSNPGLLCAEPAWVSAPTALTNLHLSCLVKGDDNLVAWMVVGLLVGNLDLLFYFQCFLKWGARVFLLVAERVHVTGGVGYILQRVQGPKRERDQWWWVSDIVKTRKTSKLLAACQIPGWLFPNSFVVPYK